MSARMWGMRGAGCERTEEVLAALRAGGLGDEAAAHAAECRGCGEALAVERWLAAEATAAAAEAELPAPELAWWRAERRARARHAERAVAAIAWWQRLAVASGAVTGGAAAWLARDSWLGWLGDLLGGWQSVAETAGPLSFVAVAAVALALVAAGVYGVWAEE